jgi:hypothetical protein
MLKHTGCYVLLGINFYQRFAFSTVWINTSRLEYLLRGRRGLSVRVGNITIRRAYIGREKAI